MAPARLPSAYVDVSPLAQPLHFEFSGKTASNRFLMAAMVERLSSWDPKNYQARGIPSKNLINVWKHWGDGGFGLILTGNIMIAYDQLEAPGNPIIPKDAQFLGERFKAFKEMEQQSKKHGSLVVGQVRHPGRQAEERLQPNPVSASDVQLEGEVLGMKFAKLHAANETEIKKIIAGFTHAAEYLYKAEYDGIELHRAHGFLLTQFLFSNYQQAYGSIWWQPGQPLSDHFGNREVGPREVADINLVHGWHQAEQHRISSRGFLGGRMQRALQCTGERGPVRLR